MISDSSDGRFLPGTPGVRVGRRGVSPRPAGIPHPRRPLCALARVHVGSWLSTGCGSDSLRDRSQDCAIGCCWVGGAGGGRRWDHTEEGGGRTAQKVPPDTAPIHCRVWGWAGGSSARGAPTRARGRDLGRDAGAARGGPGPHLHPGPPRAHPPGLPLRADGTPSGGGEGFRADRDVRAMVSERHLCGCVDPTP